jgi:hypothetical protein
MGIKKTVLFSLVLLPLASQASEFLDFCTAKYGGEREQLFGTGPASKNWEWDKDCVSKVRIGMPTVFGPDVEVGLQVWRPGAGEKGWINILMDIEDMLDEPKKYVVKSVGWIPSGSSQRTASPESTLSFDPSAMALLRKYRSNSDADVQVNIPIAPGSWPRRH